jgi:hypothetical protein
VSWAAAGSLRTLAAAVLLCAVACSSPNLPAIATPSPSATVDQSPSPSPNSTSDETPVAQRVLPPATDPPVANLCSKPITTTSDQNAVPLFCTNGAVNVLAWAFYGAVGASILGLGLNPSNGQPQAAICDDIAHNGAKASQEVSAYRLAAAYYGWAFTFDPAKVTCS